MTDGADTTIPELVSAIRDGDTERIAGMLANDASLAAATLPGNPRSMLHHATDWPGHRPNVATTIALLVDAGADPNVGMPPGDDLAVAETPLHWAASSNDAAAVDALIDEFFDAEGNVRADTGVLPHWNSVPAAQTVLDRAFQFACRAGHLDIAKRLLERGADHTAITPANTSALDEARENGHSHVVDWLTTR